jgi:hypothetical protein
MNRSSHHPVLAAIAIIVACTLCASAAFSAVGDTLSVGNGSGLPGQNGRSFSVILKNVTKIKGLIFTLKDVPDSLVVTGLTLTERGAGYRVDSASVGGSLKIMMIPTNHSTHQMAAGNDTILNVTVRVNANATGGTKATLSLINTSAADSFNVAVAHGLKGGYFWFGQKGDVMYNAAIDLFDVLRMIDIAISRPPTPTDYERWAGDFDSNGGIDVVDIGRAIDLAIGSTSSFSPGGDEPSVAGSARIEVAPLPQNVSGKIQIPVNLKASAAVSGLQLVLKVNSKQYKVSAPTSTSLSRDMSVVSRQVGDELHILLCGAKGESIPAGEGVVLSLPVTILEPLKETSEIKIEHALAATEGAARLEAFFGKGEDKGTLVPQSFALFQNNPNPFNMSTTITYDVPNMNQGAVAVRLAIYNIQGQLVRTLEDQQRTAGRYTVHWNGTDNSGSQVASGVYFYKLVAGDVALSKKLAIMK